MLDGNEISKDRFDRMASKIRMAEDALERANDQLEGEPDGPAWRYVRDQVDKAHDWLIDANAIILAWQGTWWK
jgi:hypothetical protein